MFQSQIHHVHSFIWPWLRIRVWVRTGRILICWPGNEYIVKIEHIPGIGPVLE